MSESIWTQRCERVLQMIERAALDGSPAPKNSQIEAVCNAGGSDTVKKVLELLVSLHGLTVEKHETRIGVRRFVLANGKATGWTQFHNDGNARTYARKKKVKPKTNRELLEIIRKKNPGLLVWINQEGVIASKPKYKAVR